VRGVSLWKKSKVWSRKEAIGVGSATRIAIETAIANTPTARQSAVLVRILRRFAIAIAEGSSPKPGLAWN
jgi:hypothetical protein